MIYQSVGALATEAQLERGATPAPGTPAASGGVPTVLVVGGLAVVGFLVIRHFRRKR